jgi:hypothetical protein
MTKSLRITRRTVLKGLGTAIALPVLEAMEPLAGLAGPVPSLPRRMAFLYIPNGAHMADWTPAAVGKEFLLPPTLEPLRPFQKDMLVLSGLTLDKARSHGDGPGDHARAMSTFLTGRQPRKTYGADIRVGISVDQLAARTYGSQTRLPSLELGCDRGQNAGNCDSGYSCAYSSNISWLTESTPAAKEINPRLVFERLFADDRTGEAGNARARRMRYRLSVLDFVMEDAAQLKNRLGGRDRHKLDEYLSAVRELEVRITQTPDAGPRPAAPLDMPAGVPTDYAEHLRLMADLMVVAFQGDVTRIATLVFANDASNRSYSFLGVPEGHHDLSHHGGSKDKQAKLRIINQFHVRQLAYLLGRLKAIREGDGTLLDRCMIVYGSGISDGNRHNHDDLPVLLAGRGGGTLHTGRHLRYPKETPLANLYLAMLDRVGVRGDTFGDSTGRLADLG